MFYIPYIYVLVSGLTAEHSGSRTSLLQSRREGVTSSFGTKATRCPYFSLILVFVKAAREPSCRRLLLRRNRNKKTVSSHQSQSKSWKCTALPLNIRFTSLLSFLLEQGAKKTPRGKLISAGFGAAGVSGVCGKACRPIRDQPSIV